MKKILSILLVSLTLLSVLSVAVSAAPYATYTYSAGGQVLTSPAAYVPDQIIDPSYMGLPASGSREISDPRDLFVGPDQKV